MREDVCRLILKHNDEREIRTDKRLQVLHDGLRFEIVRYEPNTGEGLKRIREHCRRELFYSGWAKTKENFVTWRGNRGWNA